MILVNKVNDGRFWVVESGGHFSCVCPSLHS